MQSKKQMYRVNLGLGPALTTSVFIRAKSRKVAEQRALKQNPGARIVTSPFPQTER